MRKVAGIGWANTVRFLRDRSSYFFVFAFPILIILFLGVVFGSGFQGTIGVYVAEEGPLADSLVDRIDGLDDITVKPYDDEDRMVDEVQRGILEGALVVPAGYDETLLSGGIVELGFVSRPDQSAQLIGEAVGEAVAAEATPIRAARFAEQQGAGTFAEALPIAVVVSDDARSVKVEYREAGEPLFEGFDQLGQFDLGAASQLTLFMFLISLAASADLIKTRQLGVAARMLSTPTRTSTIVAGETLGRYGVALTQGLYIMLGTLLMFRVDWGDPAGAIAIVLLFAAVGSGAGMLMGALFENDQQAGGLGVLFGLVLAAAGGAMVPVEVFPETMQTVAKFTPHYWAIDGFTEMVRRGGSLDDILLNLAILAGFAVLFQVLATWRLHRTLTR